MSAGDYQTGCTLKTGRTTGPTDTDYRSPLRLRSAPVVAGGGRPPFRLRLSLFDYDYRDFDNFDYDFLSQVIFDYDYFSIITTTVSSFFTGTARLSFQCIVATIGRYF